MSKTLSEVYVATCDEEIFEYVESIGGKAVMTSDSHERCSDRCAEAMLKIEKNTGQKCDIMVMVQGDEPLTFPQMIDVLKNQVGVSDDDIKRWMIDNPSRLIDRDSD